MKRNKVRKICATIGMAIIVCFSIEITSKAGLQAKPGATSLKSTTANNFFIKIRNMEAEGGTLGLNAEIDTTTYLDTTGNGVDVHMAKNTEWGAAAMLAASIYGTAPTGNSSASTTGNATGVYQMADSTYEYVAGIYNTSNNYMGTIKKADARYYDLYTTTTAATGYKYGDATYETANWKGAGNADFVASSFPVFARSNSGLFSFDSSYGNGSSYGGSRAVLVVGAGL